MSFRKTVKETYVLETVCEKAEITEELRRSTALEDIKTVLRAGQIPDAYEGVIEKVSHEVTYRGSDKGDSGAEAVSPYPTEAEAQERAAEGYFVRLPDNNAVICPAGQKLPQKCIRKSGEIVCAQRAACAQCEHRANCTKSQTREIGFTKDELEKPNRKWHKAMNGGFAPRNPQKRGRMTKWKW